MSARIGGLRAQRLFECAAVRSAPALAAAGVASAHTRRAGDALVVLAGMALANGMLRRDGWPLHVTVLARHALDTVVAVAGIGLAAAIAAVAGDGLAAGTIVPSLAAVLAITILARWLEVGVGEHCPVRVAVIGRLPVAEALHRELRAADVRSFRIVGLVLEPDASRTPLVPGGPVPCLGRAHELRAVVKDHDIDLLALAPERSRIRLLETLTDALDLPVRVLDAEALYELMLGRVAIRTINGAWFQHLMHPGYSPGSRTARRLLDIAVALAIGLLALPLAAAYAIAMKLRGRGPLLYRQRRVGEGGREFDILKLRTMQDDEPGGPVWSRPGDARTTAIGRLARRSHLDEVPQLYNVLRGEMSIVGPRPERPEIVAALERAIPHYRRRHLARPGITGWAQVRCGYAGTYPGTACKLAHDLYYLKRRSLLFDFLILIETVAAVVTDVERGLVEVSEELVVGKVAHGG